MPLRTALSDKGDSKEYHLKILFALLFLAAMPVYATTYYVDYSAGSDSNNGTAKTTPWQHLPGMPTATGNAASHTIAPPDNFILKGGITWPAANFGMQMVFTGSSSSSSAVGCAGSGCIYIGVDPSWFSGASWTRPIFDGGGTMAAAFPGGMPSAVVDLYGGYFILDNIEFAHWAQTSNTPGTPSIVAMRGNHEETKNSYFHGWSHSGTATQDNLQIFGGTASCPPDMTSSIHDNVADGSDTTEDAFEFAHPGVGYIYNNYVAHIHNGIVGSAIYVFQNTFLHINGSFDPTSHGNVVESTGCQLILYSNYANDANGGASIFNGPHDGMVDFDFNNVLTAQQNQIIEIDGNELGTGVGSGIYVFNNTLQSPAGFGGGPVDGPTRGGTLPFMKVYNNNLIADNSNVYFGTNVSPAGQAQANNLTWTNAQATAAGYNSGESPYPYAPPTGTSATVGTGVNQSICGLLVDSPPALAATACNSDTSFGVGYDSVNHVVIVPGRATVARPNPPSAGALEWAGAGSGGGVPPLPPTGLTLTVH